MGDKYIDSPEIEQRKYEMKLSNEENNFFDHLEENIAPQFRSHIQKAREWYTSKNNLSFGQAQHLVKTARAQRVQIPASVNDVINDVMQNEIGEQTFTPQKIAPVEVRYTQPVFTPAPVKLQAEPVSKDEVKKLLREIAEKFVELSYKL